MLQIRQFLLLSHSWPSAAAAAAAGFRPLAAAIYRVSKRVSVCRCVFPLGVANGTCRLLGQRTKASQNSMLDFEFWGWLWLWLPTRPKWGRAIGMNTGHAIERVRLAAAAAATTPKRCLYQLAAVGISLTNSVQLSELRAQVRLISQLSLGLRVEFLD